MSIVLTEEAEAPTFADLLERLGNVSPSRIRLHPPPGQATEQDVLDIHAHSDRLFELIDGTLVEWAYSFRNAVLSASISHAIGQFAAMHHLGIVTGAGGPMRVSPRRIRMSSVSFVSWSQLPNRWIPKEAIPNLHPDLAVEVLSDSNTPAEMAIKRKEYFVAGTRLVWQIDPRARTAEVFTAPSRSTPLDISGILDGGTVLPGFTLPLAELFGELDRDFGPPC